MAFRFFTASDPPKPDLSSLADEQLLQRYALVHDPEVLGQLFGRYTHLVFSVCMKYLGDTAEAEDTTMAIFEKLVEELKHAEVKAFKSWLYTVTRNQCLMQLRHNKAVQRSKDEIMREMESEIMESASSGHPVPGENELGLLQNLETAMQRLNDAQRQCIALFYLEERSYREVAETTGFSLNEVKSHLQNGRRNLRILLENAREL